MKQFVILSMCISVIFTWCRMIKVSKDVGGIVVSRLCHGSCMRVVGKELDLSQSCI